MAGVVTLVFTRTAEATGQGGYFGNIEAVGYERVGGCLVKYLHVLFSATKDALRAYSAEGVLP